MIRAGLRFLDGQSDIQIEGSPAHELLGEAALWRAEAGADPSAVSPRQPIWTTGSVKWRAWVHIMLLGFLQHPDRTDSRLVGL